MAKIQQRQPTTSIGTIRGNSSADAYFDTRLALCFLTF